MPPPSARTLIHQPSICRSCATSTLRRTYATVSQANNKQQQPAHPDIHNELAPQSPRYVDVRKPPQPSYPPRPKIKGVLPVPRNVFIHRSKADKGSEEFIARATAEPKSGHVSSGKDAEYIAWKQRMSESRRRNLREGLLSLAARKRAMDAAVAGRQSRRAAERDALIARPPRDDEQYTEISVDAGLRAFLDGGAAPHQRTPAEVERMRANVRAKQKEKSAERKAALHTLYMNARRFITNEQQLKKAIDDAFGAPGHPKGWGPDGDRPSPWAEGPPLTAAAMLRRSAANEFTLAERRMKKIAEELTGGTL